MRWPGLNWTTQGLHLRVPLGNGPEVSGLSPYPAPAASKEAAVAGFPEAAAAGHEVQQENKLLFQVSLARWLPGFWGSKVCWALSSESEVTAWVLDL